MRCGIRRRARSLCALLGVALFAAGSQAASRPAVVSPQHAEELFRRLPADDPWLKNPDGSTLAWGESHLLHALVDLYEATDDIRYLAEVARRGDRLLAHRDDRRGVADGSGHSRPAWSMASKYVVADGQLKDARGRTVVSLRSTASAYNNLTKVEVKLEDAASGRFTLRVSNAQFKREERFDELSLDPANERYIEKVVNPSVPTRSPRAGFFTNESNLLLARVHASSDSRIAAQTTTLRPIPLAYMGYLGVIYHPMLRFAEIVRKETRLGELVAAADRFVRAAEESYADASRRLWRDGPGSGEGYYLCCEKGESFPYDNVGEPFNYLGRHTATQLALHRLTGRPEYLDRAEKMSRLFKHRLRHDAARDLYVWNYWYEPVTTTGWTPANSPSFNIPNQPAVAAIEDISHGVLDVAMVVAAYDAKVVFDDADLRRFANTLLTNVLNPERTNVRRRVDGSAGEYPAYFPALAGWLELTRANPAVYRDIRRAVESGGPDDLQLMAALLKWERKTAGQSREGSGVGDRD